MVYPLTAVIDRLATDPALSAILTGGVYGRAVKRTGDQATPYAYSPDPPHHARPAAIVVDDGDSADLTGPPAAQVGFVSVWFYAPCTVSGRTAVAEAIERTRQLLAGWSFPAVSGLPARFDGPGQRLGARDDPVDDHRLVDRVRFPVAAVWRLA